MRVILVVPLIAGALYLAYSGVVRGHLTAWEGDTPDSWSGHSATLGGFGRLALTACLTLALIYTSWKAKSDWLIVFVWICAFLFLLLEGMATVIA